MKPGVQIKCNFKKDQSEIVKETALMSALLQVFVGSEVFWIEERPSEIAHHWLDVAHCHVHPPSQRKRFMNEHKVLTNPV